MPILTNDNANFAERPKSTGPPKSTERYCTALLVLITCAAALLRFWQCSESLWLDETHTAWTVADGLQEITPRAKSGNYGPVYFWLPWLSTRLFGLTEVALRLPSLLAGICLVPVCFFIARDWFRSPVLGVLAASLVAIDPHSLFYSLEARPYALVQLFSAVHVWLLLRMLSVPARNNWAQRAMQVRTTKYDGLPRPSKTNVTNPTALKGHRTEPVEEPILNPIAGPVAKPVTERTSEQDLSSQREWLNAISFCAIGVLLFQFHYTTGLLFTAEGTIVGLAFLVGRRNAAVRAAGCLAIIGVSCLTSWNTIRHIAARRDLWNQFIERNADFLAIYPWGEYLGSATVVAFICWCIVSQRRGKSNQDTHTHQIPWNRLAVTLIWLIVPLSFAFVLTRFDFARLFYRRYTMFCYPPLILLTACIGILVPTRQGKAAYSFLLFAVIFFLIGPQRQFDIDQRFVRHSHEDWRSATRTIRNASKSPRELHKPILVRTGLVEERLVPTQAELGVTSEYLLFPISSIYALGKQRAYVLTSTLVTTDEAIGQIARHDGGWLIVRGRKWFDANKSSISVELSRRLSLADPTIRSLQIETVDSRDLDNLVLAKMTLVRRLD